MKKVCIAVLALVCNMTLFSCTNDALAETDAVYQTQATEGDDEDPDKEERETDN